VLRGEVHDAVVAANVAASEGMIELEFIDDSGDGADDEADDEASEDSHDSD
jgi:hypothetical protein